MTQAKLGDKVLVHYTGKLQDGTVFDSSTDRQPLEFALGGGQIIPGFEQAVIGMSPGESKTEVIPSAQAYGDRRPEMVLEIDRQQLPSDLEIQEGQQLQLQDPSGQVIAVTVADIQNSKVTLDANHPLAGEDLIFEIELVELAA